MNKNDTNILNIHRSTIENVSEKYNSLNPISRKLISNFYCCLKEMLVRFDEKTSFLEIGCGPGESTRRIIEMIKSSNIEASEFDQNIVNALNYLDFPIPIKQESVYELKRENNSIDCVLLLEVLEHLEDYNKALEEVFRVSKSTVIISVPNEPLWCNLNLIRGKYWSDRGNTPGHLNHWNKKNLVSLINQFGKVEEVKMPLPWIMIKAKKIKPIP